MGSGGMSAGTGIASSNSNEHYFPDSDITHIERGPDYFDTPDFDESSMSKDAKEVRQFFRDNTDYEDWINGFTVADRHALRSWASGYFMDGSHYDKPLEKLYSHDKEVLQRIYDQIDKVTIKQPFVTYRKAGYELLGKTNLSLQEIKAMEGEEVGTLGGMSTSAATHGLDIGRTKPVEYEFHFPGGSKGAGAYIGDRRINPDWGAGQREFMTRGEIKFRVGKATEQSDGTIKVEMHYVGKLTKAEKKHLANYMKNGNLFN